MQASTRSSDGQHAKGTGAGLCKHKQQPQAWLCASSGLVNGVWQSDSCSLIFSCSAYTPRPHSLNVTHQYFIFCPGVYLLVASMSTLMPAVASMDLTFSAASITPAFSSRSWFQKMGITITCMHGCTAWCCYMLLTGCNSRTGFRQAKNWYGFAHARLAGALLHVHHSTINESRLSERGMCMVVWTTNSL